MTEQAISTRSGADKVDEESLAELRRELAGSKEEVLRLRDLLIGKDAELGALKGRVAELEAGAARLLNLGAHLRSRVPSFVWSARARLGSRRES